MRELKSLLRKIVYGYRNFQYLIKFKLGIENREIFKQIDIKGIKSVKKSGEGFCDTFIIKAHKNIVLKINNQNRINYFREDYEKCEPIYLFLHYKKRFRYEKDIFERVNCKNVNIIDNIIIFPFIESKPLSSFLNEDIFYKYLEDAISILKSKKISHGDFHIENILVGDKIYLIDFEMIFGDYLKKEEQFYYDIYYLFAKLEYKYPIFYNENYVKLKNFIYKNFTDYERDSIIGIANKTKKFFLSVNGAKIDLFR